MDELRQPNGNLRCCVPPHLRLSGRWSSRGSSSVERRRFPKRVSKSTPHEEVVFLAVNDSLRKWGRWRWAKWSAFEPLVSLGLSIVETEAVRLVEEEDLPRDLTEEDRQMAAWMVLKRAIETLRPVELADEVQEALGRLPAASWPTKVSVPWELQAYLVVVAEYQWRLRVSKIAEWLLVEERTVAYIRRDAIRTLARRILAWESRAHPSTSPRASTR
jgi:hypothetical protein